MNRAERRVLAKKKMYQVNVTVINGAKEFQTPVGPRFDKRHVVEEYCAKINRAIAEGKERNWRDARVIETNFVRAE